jgi:hypothetical protein
VVLGVGRCVLLALALPAAEVAGGLVLLALALPAAVVVGGLVLLAVGSAVWLATRSRR